MAAPEKNEKERKRKMRRIISMVLCMTLAGCLIGCGEKDAQNGRDVTNTQKEGAMEGEASAKEAGGELLPEPKQSLEEGAAVPTTYVPLSAEGMGRYMEEEVGNFRQYDRRMKITKEGIWLLGATEAAFRKNGSEEFEPVFYPQIIRETYVSAVAVSDQGDMVFRCFEKNTEGAYEFLLRAVKKDGTVLEMDRIQDKESIGSMNFGPDGKLYVHRYGKKNGIYRYDLQEGEGEFVFITSSILDDFTFLGNLLVAIVDGGQVRIYDIETDTLQEQDSVLDAFCGENLTGIGSYDMDFCSAYIFGSDEENVLYLVCDKGIFRHVLYGSVMEQVVSGGLSMLGNPAASPSGAGFFRDENGNMAFLVGFYPGKVMRYIYDPEVPTVPKRQLHVYSLEENDDLRQIIALFQQTYPDCYVKYEVGLSSVGAANADDKMKQLNTAILSGNGPDILVTDGLDEENYSSRGLLQDLSTLAEEMTGKDALAPNLTEALKQDGKLYSLPVAFRIPMIAGEKEFVEGIYDMESLTAAVEAMREENPEGVILTSTIPEAILAVLAQTESGNWVKDGSLDEDSLRDFLSCAYRLYETETKGVTEAWMEEEQAELEESISYISPNLLSRLEEIYYSFNNTLKDVMLKGRLSAIGFAGNPVDLCWVDQLPETYTFTLLEDGEGAGFKPVMKLAINATSPETEMAQNFVRLALSWEAGKLNFSTGIPTNMAAVDYIMKDWKHMSWGMHGTNKIGEEVELNAYWPLQRTLTKYQEAIESVDHVIEENYYLMQQVIEIGAEAMREGKTVDEAVAEIKRKTAIYLEE